MTQWYVKELSKLTHVSVQTLHHYDRIGLLRPSVRLENGYRLYSEKDLLKLQQIVALKFFGFPLTRIKALLAQEVEVLESFRMQSIILEEEAKTLLDASAALKKILSDCDKDESIPWKSVIKLIEVYHMTKELQRSWAGKVLDPQELKEYASFAAEVEQRYSPEESTRMKKRWADLVQEINANLANDPASESGRNLGKSTMQWVNDLYGKDHVALRTAIWEKGFKNGHGAEEHGMSPEAVAWMDKAISAHYEHTIGNILSKAAQDSSNPQVKKEWQDLLTSMFGNDKELRQDFIKQVLQDPRMIPALRTWLQS